MFAFVQKLNLQTSFHCFIARNQSWWILISESRLSSSIVSLLTRNLDVACSLHSNQPRYRDLKPRHRSCDSLLWIKSNFRKLDVFVSRLDARVCGAYFPFDSRPHPSRRRLALNTSPPRAAEKLITDLATLGFVQNRNLQTWCWAFQRLEARVGCVFLWIFSSFESSPFSFDSSSLDLRRSNQLWFRAEEHFVPTLRLLLLFKS